MEVCRLCLDLATESDVKKLEGTYKDATQIVLPEVNTDISSSPVICQQCTSSLDELYAFKASVVETEHQIKEKVGDDKCQLHLKEVMTGVKIDKKDADLGKSKDRMCRTCLCAIEGETFTVLKPTQSDAYLNSMLLMCLPEMELELTLDPVMCEQCLSNLQKLYHFKSSCLDVEERLNSYCQQHGTSSRNQINLHSVLEEDAAESKDHNFTAVKSEPIDSSVGDYKSEEDDDVSMSDNSKDLGYTVVKVKKEEQDEDDTEDGDESMGDDAENFTDEEIGELKQEEIKLEDDDEDGAKKNRYFIDISKTHLNLEQDQSHVIRTNQKKLPLRTCDFCDYTSPVKTNLRKHTQRMHINKKILKCHHCEYTTKHKCAMVKHAGRHNQENLPLLKCHLCDYTSRLKHNLAQHVRINHSNKQFRCDYCVYPNKLQRCEFSTKYKVAINRHIDEHHNPKGLPLIKCQLCNYECHVQANLNKHVRNVHTDTPIKCELCKYITNYKQSLKRHVEARHSQK